MKLKDRICEMEFTWLPITLFWGFVVLCIVGAVAFIYAAIHLLFGYVIFLGTIDNGIRVQSNNHFCEIEFPEYCEIEFPEEEVEEVIQEPEAPVIHTKDYPVGCEYWNGYINTMEANEEEKTWLSRIMFCESTCNPYAISHAGATGLMQYMPKTWDWMGGGDINNPYEQLEKALMMYRKGMAHHWCCN